MTRSLLRVGYLRPLGYAAVASRVPFSLFNQSFVLIFKMTSVKSEPKTPTKVVVTNPSEIFFSSKNAATQKLDYYCTSVRTL